MHVYTYIDITRQRKAALVAAHARPPHGPSAGGGPDQGHTNFHFTVQKDSLEAALDRFAQFFVAPLLSPSPRFRPPPPFVGHILGRGGGLSCCGVAIAAPRETHVTRQLPSRPSLWVWVLQRRP